MPLPETTDTIVAQATPAGAGALAVIRLSGPGAFSVAEAFLRPAQHSPSHARACLLSVMDGRRLIDRAVTVFYRGPSSYTGDDTVEICCHGSPYITRTILNLSARNGARPAEPGEFTLRAFLNGKLDLAQAEAVGRLIEAGSRSQHQAAISQAEGSLSGDIAGIRRALTSLLAEVEARLDDSYEEIPPLARRAFISSAKAARARTLGLAAGYEAGRGIRDGLNVVISGAPNSGKSSLLNAILGYGRAMVSGTAGTTRDTLEASLEVDGFTVRFTDTAGLGTGRAGRLEKEGMARARDAAGRADFIILVKDSSAPESPADRLAEKEITRLAPRGAKIFRAYNKADLGQKRRGKFNISAKTGLGLEALKSALVAGQKKLFREGSQAAAISSRHFSALSGTAGELGRVISVMSGEDPRLELAAEHLRGAAAALSSITGETAPEEVLSEIFGSFCVGK